MKPILKGRIQKTRILRPEEYNQIRLHAGDHRTNLDACLLLGARYVECQRIQQNPEWVENSFVIIPEEHKKKRTTPQRWIRLNPIGKRVLEQFAGTKKLPTLQNWKDDLRRWATSAGIDPTGLGCKTTRKTWESWLVYYYPDRVPQILLNQGHTDLVSLQHYLNLPFVERDKQLMREWVSGWI